MSELIEKILGRLHAINRETIDLIETLEAKKLALSSDVRRTLALIKTSTVETSIESDSSSLGHSDDLSD